MKPQGLSRLRVLDLSEGVAGPFCAKLLGDLGADVIKIEPPGGDAARGYGPFPEETPHPERSASFLFFNTSKRSAVLDLERAEDRETLRRLTQRYDIVIAGDPHERLAERGLDFETLLCWNPRIILTTISPFGSFGPCSGYQATHLINCAVGGWAQLCGTPEGPPLQCGGAVTETLTGAYAAAATALAAFGRARHGAGEHIDVSIQEAVLAGAHLPTLNWEYRGIAPERYSSVGSGAGVNVILPTETGYIGLNSLTLAQWRLLCGFLGREDIADDPRYAGVSWAQPDERLEEIRSAFRQALNGRSREQLFHEAQQWRVPFGLVPSLGELLELPPHRERGFFHTIEHPAAGSFEVPRPPFLSAEMSAAPGRAPLLDEHRDEILAEAAGLEAAAAEPAAPPHSKPLPLEGIRVIDFSMFFAGPVCAQILADAGAEVIKVESLQRIDGWRGAASGSAAGEVPSWESSPYFNWVNRNKRGVTLNLTDPRGVAAAKALVRDADVVIENYTPRVMQNFGLSWEVLREQNPRLVMLSLSGFGHTSSWRDYVAFGMSTEQMSGVCHLTGYEGGEPLFTGMTGGDLYAGVMGANVLLAALHHRDLTGHGQHLDLSQIEACALYLGDALTGWSLAGHDPGRTGNRHPRYAPHGIYPCRDDRWIAIACRSDGEWAALRAIIGGGRLPAGDLGSAEARRARRAELDAAIAAWTREASHVPLMHELQAAGVPAGAVMNGPELLADPQLRARGSLLAQDRPGIGTKHYPGQPYRFRTAVPPPNVRAPLLGEHSAEVLTRLAGISEEELVELIVDDVTGTEPIAAR